jgi:hypothetical protein
MALLETQIEIPKTAEAADGRFFVVTPEEPPIEPSYEDKLKACLTALRPDALAAFDTLGKIERARIIRETDKELPGLQRPEVVEEAGYQSADLGTIWRRQTDAISATIAGEFPNQPLHNPMFDNDHEVFISDGSKLYRIGEDGSVAAFTSLISQNEMNAGVRMADEAMWSSLLLNITLVG